LANSKLHQEVQLVSPPVQQQQQQQHKKKGKNKRILTGETR